MTWKWDQSSGTLTRNGKFICRGYSGRDWGKNNPEAETATGIGPIPVGRWKIGAPYDSKNVGPYALRLDSMDEKPGDDTHQGTGRGAFRIHGDSIKNPGTASHGCIILARAIRQAIWDSGDHELEVVE
jgi:hypothetical protein